MIGLRKKASSVVRVLTGLCLLFAASVVETREGTSPAPEKSETEFKSRLVYRSAAGDFVPILDPQLFAGSGQGGCQPSLQSEIELKIGPNGEFSVHASPGVIVSRSRAFDAPPGEGDLSCTETKVWPCYRFRAPGCRDQWLRFSEDKQPADPVVMVCPSRGGS